LRVLALDYGTRRVGVAVSDPAGIFAQPLETLRYRGPKDASLLRRIVARVEEFAVEQIVVGLPLHMEGRKGPEAQAAEAFGARVAKETQVPVSFLDERWTTVEAQRAFVDMGVRGREARAHVDAVAASLILRAWLAQQPSKAGDA